MRVVQIDPGPMPQRMLDAPALIRSSAPSVVATLPPMIGKLGYALRSSATCAMTAAACPCELSTSSTSAPASINAAARCMQSALTPTAAPTRKRPSESLVALG